MLARQSESHEKILSSLNEAIAKLQDESSRPFRDAELTVRVAQRDQLLREIYDMNSTVVIFRANKIK